MLEKAFKQFDLLANYAAEDANNRASNRVKILIKNLFDNRQSGWDKSQKQEKKIQTKDEVERQMVAQQKQQ